MNVATACTLAERIKRTNALLDYLSVLWADGRVDASIHGLPHAVIHQTESEATHFTGGNGHPLFLLTRMAGLRLFGEPDAECETCRALPRVAPDEIS